MFHRHATRSSSHGHAHCIHECLTTTCATCAPPAFLSCMRRPLPSAHALPCSRSAPGHASPPCPRYPAHALAHPPPHCGHCNSHQHSAALSTCASMPRHSVLPAHLHSTHHAHHPISPYPHTSCAIPLPSHNRHHPQCIAIHQQRAQAVSCTHFPNCVSTLLVLPHTRAIARAVYKSSHDWLAHALEPVPRAVYFPCPTSHVA